MGDVIKVNRVEKQDSNTDVKKINNGIGDSVYECMKMLANKSKVSSYEPRHEKTGFLHMRKQRRRSASR